MKSGITIAALSAVLVACGGDDSSRPSGGTDAGTSAGDADLPDLSDLPDAQPADVGPPPAPAPLMICDGSPGVRLAYVVPTGQGSPGRAVILENGHNYLFVDGACRYWAFHGNPYVFGEPSGDLKGARTGVLDGDRANRLSDELQTGSWAEWRGNHYSPGSPADSVPDLLWVPGAEITCTGCYASMPGLRDAILKARAWLEELEKTGEPLTGPVRIAAVNMQQSLPSWQHAVAEWPLQQPVGAFVIPFPFEASPGQGFRVEGDHAGTLRQLRANTLDGKYYPVAGGHGPPAIPVRDSNGDLHFVFVRDTLPFESVIDGLVPWPPGP